MTPLHMKSTLHAALLFVLIGYGCSDDGGNDANNGSLTGGVGGNAGTGPVAGGAARASTGGGSGGAAPWRVAARNARGHRAPPVPPAPRAVQGCPAEEWAVPQARAAPNARARAVLR